MESESSAGTGARTGAGGQDGAGLTLSCFLPYRLNVAAAMVSEGLARTYGERFGIGIPEWRVLATIGEFDSITATAIGRHSHMGKVKVSRAASSLEAKGLIRRVPNQEDLREAFLALTAEGRTVYREIAGLALAYVDRLTAGFPAADLVALDRLLDTLMSRAREIGRGGPNGFRPHAGPPPPSTLGQAEDLAPLGQTSQLVMPEAHRRASASSRERR